MMFDVAEKPPLATRPGTDPEAEGALSPDERRLRAEGRWLELLEHLLDRAERASEEAARAALLRRAARIYEENLGDLEKAFITLQAALVSDVGNDELAAELERVAGLLGRYRGLVTETEQALAALPPEGRVTLLLRIAGWYDRCLGDSSATEERLLVALDIDPGASAAARSLAALYGRRGAFGDAVETLAAAAAAGRDAADRARLFAEAAALAARRLEDEGRAAGLYAEALQQDPQHAGALQALAAIASSREDWSGVETLCESLGGLPTLPLDERAAYLQRAAEAALKRGNVEAARAHHQQAIAAHPSKEALLALGALGEEHGHWEDVRATSELLLRHPNLGVSLSAGSRLELEARLGRALVALGRPAEAILGLERALAHSPNHRGCREVLLAAHTHRGDAAGVLAQQQALLVVDDDEHARFDRLIAIARLQRDQSQDLAAAAATFTEALALRPDDRAVVAELLDLETALKQWKQTVPLLLRLAELEPDGAKAPYLVAAANILHYELRSADEAVELYEQALDHEPADLKTFERIDKILTAKRAWKDEARAYRRMIKRLSASPAGEHGATLLMLWRGLGEIYRTRLQDLAAAEAAFEVCAQLTPDDLSLHEMIAELCERQGAEGLGRAIERRALLAERAGSPGEMARHLKALRTLQAESQRPDRVFSVCAALVTLGQADETERAYYDRGAALGPSWPRATLTEELWQKVVYHPSEERRLSAILSLVGPILALVRGKDARAHGLKDKQRLPSDDGSPIDRLLAYVSGLLALPRPAVYVVRDAPAELEVLNVVEQGRPAPAVVMGGERFARRTDREAAFLFGRIFARLRLEHLALARSAVGSDEELVLALRALVKLFQKSVPQVGEDQPAFKQYLALFERALPPHALDPLMATLPWLAENVARLDLAAWRAGVERTAHRAGLLVCGDVGLAARLTRESAGPLADEIVRDLLAWSISEPYSTVREQLGLLVALPHFPTESSLSPAPAWR